MGSISFTTLETLASAASSNLDLLIPKMLAAWEPDASAATWEYDSHGVSSYTDSGTGTGLVTLSNDTAASPTSMLTGVNSWNGGGRHSHRYQSSVSDMTFYNASNTATASDPNVQSSITLRVVNA